MMLPTMTDELVRRFMARVEVTDSCWFWTGLTQPWSNRPQPTRRGALAGLFGVRVDGKSRKVRAHRLAHEWWVGPIPAGFEVDHLCFNPGCVRPDHLEAVTREENTRRARAAGRFQRNCLPTGLGAHGQSLTHYTHGGCRCEPCVTRQRE